MEEKRVYVKSWQINALEIFLSFFLAALAVSFFAALVTKSLKMSAPLLSLSLLSLWILFLEYKAEKLWIFCLGHLPLIGIVILISQSVLRWCCGVYLVGLTAYSFHRRYSPQNEQDTVTLLIIGMIIMTIMYVVCSVADILFYRDILLTSGAFFCILYVVYIHAAKVNKMLFMQNQQHIIQPIKKIRHTNWIFLLCFLGVMLLVFEGMMAIPWDGATGHGMLVPVILKCFAWLIGAFGMLFEGGSSQEVILQESQESVGAANAEEAPWMVWVVLEKIFNVVMLVIMIALFCFFLYCIYKSLRNRKRIQNRKAEEPEDDVQEFITRIKKKKEKPNRRLQLKLSNEQKVRRLFYKKVRLHMDKSVVRSDTPEQIQKKLPEEELEAQLVSLYDQARYSRKPVTDEDWENLTAGDR